SSPSGRARASPADRVRPVRVCRHARHIRTATGVVTRAVGMIFTPQQAERILADGDADMIALGRPFMDEPRWGWRAAEALDAPMPHFPKPYHLVRTPAWIKARDEASAS